MCLLLLFGFAILKQEGSGIERDRKTNKRITFELLDEREHMVVGDYMTLERAFHWLAGPSFDGGIRGVGLTLALVL